MLCRFVGKTYLCNIKNEAITVLGSPLYKGVRTFSVTRYSRGSGSIGILIKLLLKTEKTSHSNGGPRLMTPFFELGLQSER